jgi:hypothetical protein
MVDMLVVVGWTNQPNQTHGMHRYGFGPYPYRSTSFVKCVRAAFFKLWSADHKWSSGSALVVLGLTFYEINYPAYTDVLL